MPSRRNMSWRKPVPKLIPDPPPQSAFFSRSTLTRFSASYVNKDVPPLPTEWHENVEHATDQEKRHALYITSEGESQPDEEPGSLYASSENVATRAAAELSDVPCHSASKEIDYDVDVPASPPSHSMRAHRSLPHIYRPPTPPRPGRHARRSAETLEPHCLVSPNVPSHPVYPLLNPCNYDTTSNFSALMSPHMSFEATYSREEFPPPAGVSEVVKSGKSHSRRFSSVGLAKVDSGPRRCGDTFASIWGDVKALGGYVRVKINHMLKSDNATAQTC
ncbi:hypothetical protein SCP_0209000 [Sparassis crispa]|uniref:Uncharacterized protein n=1 Tax=Sparassis crispa TaxID=139825 RepID=A0A401GC18_9APHY|nr:hypothetical protein SCP_0209000 [Sparassis crispa]GBE79700.1 hypothetical protein SCP_0209000 [Sparassis crispa]